MAVVLPTYFANLLAAEDVYAVYAGIFRSISRSFADAESAVSVDANAWARWLDAAPALSQHPGGSE